MSVITRKLKDGFVTLEGYVNVSNRDSEILEEDGHRFVEQIKSGAWKRAIKKNTINLMINHSGDVLDSTKDNLELYEDNIGLRFKIKTDNQDIVRQSKNFIGCSFAFISEDEEWETIDDNLERKIVKEMTVSEVSLLTVQPAYSGCSVETRSKNKLLFRNNLEGDEDMDNDLLVEIRDLLKALVEGMNTRAEEEEEESKEEEVKETKEEEVEEPKDDEEKPEEKITDEEEEETREEEEEESVEEEEEDKAQRSLNKSQLELLKELMEGVE